MTQENFWILLSKRIAGEASPEELKELERMLREHPEWQHASQNLELLWQSNPEPDTTADAEAYMVHLNRMHERGVTFNEDNPIVDIPPQQAPVRHRRLFLYTGIGIAASLLLFGWFFFKDHGTQKTGNQALARQVNEVSTRYGSKSHVQLPDGSLVWLNAGSKITYGKEFGKKIREVTLSGEAFFDVVKDADHPFVIHASSIDIRVLGTAFNVKAYPEDEKTETSLIRGRIEVSIKSRPNDKIILSPNEKLIVDNKSMRVQQENAGDDYEPLVAVNKLKVNPVDSTVAETQWVENRLVFDNESLRELAVKMERWYGVEIEIADSALIEKRFTGKLDNENIEQAMEALRYSSPFSFERKGNKIIIHR